MKRTQILNLGKHFSIIDSPVPFYLIDNYGFRAYRPAGAWQFDNWKLLPEKFHKNYPVYTLSIEWESGENDDIFPEFTDTDLDLGDGIAGVSGQPVMISNPVTVMDIKQPVNVKEIEKPIKLLENSLIDNFLYGDSVGSFDMIPIYAKSGSLYVRRNSGLEVYSLTDCCIVNGLCYGGRIMNSKGSFFAEVYFHPDEKTTFRGYYKKMV